jgi:arylsulfatase A-like enzyme
VSRRNIIFVLIDDLRFDAMGFLRPQLQTPHIDALARQGAHFENAFVTSSLCSPSRATIMTGLPMRNHRIIDNNEASETGLTYFPQLLQGAGYQTAFFGKWHFGRRDDQPRPGFDRWVSFMGQGNYFPTDYLSAADVAAGKVHTLNVDGQRAPQKGYMTDELTDYALNWLAQDVDRTRPFFLCLAHKAVHAIAKPPERYASQYADVDFPLPASAADTPQNNDGKPLWVRNQRNSWHGVEFLYHTGQKMTDYMREYYRTLSPVDDSVGRIVDWLHANDLARSTAIVFTSDNGYMEGEHGLIDKRNAYEESMRVPLLVWAPGLIPGGRTVSHCVSSLDFAPTLLDLAGVAAPEGYEGRSVAPLASGEIEAPDWNDEVIYEYYWEWNFPMTPSTFAIRAKNLKYIQYQGVWDVEELYDLDQDPAEMVNLIEDERYLDAKLDLRRRLFAGLADREERHVIPFTERTSAGVVFRRKDGSGTAAFPQAWLRTPGEADLLAGLFPDSKGKVEAIQRGVLPRLWIEDEAGPGEAQA